MQIPINKIYYVPTDKKLLSLTFDDGPNSPTTSIILNILKKYKIKATFFILGQNAISNQPIIKKIIEEEHTIGLHSFTHESFKSFSKLKSYRTIRHCINSFKEFGITPIYFRPPYGTLPEATQLVLPEFNLTPIGWSIIEKDWLPSYAYRKSRNFIAKCSPGKILVFHDGYRQFKHIGSTIENLNTIIPELLNKGYSFVPIPELVANKSLVNVKIFNNIPLFHYDIIDLSFYNMTVLSFYWDMNFINIKRKRCPICKTEINTELFEVQIKTGDHIKHLILKYPSPYAMEEWVQQIELPYKSINKNSEIFIKNNENFIKI